MTPRTITTIREAALHRRNWAIITLWLLTSFTFSARAEDMTSASDEIQPPNKTAWTLSLGGAQHNIKSGDGDHLIGGAFAVGLGYHYVDTNWFAGGRFDFLTGPFQSTKQQGLTVDFYGTGLDMVVGFSAENKDIRSYQGGYGFLLGMSYFDTIGRSVGEKVTQQDDVTISNWVMRVNNFSIYPAIFFAWLEEARPVGNSPDLLVTRIEGYFLTIGISVPLQTEYRVRFDADGVTQNSEGNLNGYSILVNFTTLFGS